MAGRPENHQRDDDRRNKRAGEQDDGHVPRTMAEKRPVAEGFRSKLPEGDIDHPGQLNRDNVNPNIPSAPPQKLREEENLRRALPTESQEPEGARIIPPDEGGIAPPPTPTPDEIRAQREKDAEQKQTGADKTLGGAEASINEPPGSNVLPDDTPTEPDPKAAASRSAAAGDDDDDEEDALPSHAELERMTRAELDELAEQRGVDISGAGNKQDVIDELQKDQRRRKRQRRKED